MKFVPLIAIALLVTLSACSTTNTSTVGLERNMDSSEMRGRATMGLCMASYFELKVSEIETNATTPQQAFAHCLSEPVDTSITHSTSVLALDYFERGRFSMGACMVNFADVIIFQPDSHRISAVYHECFHA